MVYKKYDWIANQLSGTYGNLHVRASTEFVKRQWCMKVEVRCSDFVSTGPGTYIYQDVLLCVHHMSDGSIDKLKRKCEEFIEKARIKYRK